MQYTSNWKFYNC